MYGNGPFPPFYNNINPGSFSGLRGPVFGGMNNPNMARNLFRGGLGSSGLFRNATNTGGLLSRLKSSGLSLSGILTNTQKTLNVVNQAIPIIKQTGPMFNNMKTMFKLASAFKDETTSNNTSNSNTTKNNTNNNNEKTEYSNTKETSPSENGPAFFIQ